MTAPVAPHPFTKLTYFGQTQQLFPINNIDREKYRLSIPPKTTSANPHMTLQSLAIAPVHIMMVARKLAMVTGALAMVTDALAMVTDATGATAPYTFRPQSSTLISQRQTSIIAKKRNITWPCFGISVILRKETTRNEKTAFFHIYSLHLLQLQHHGGRRDVHYV